MSGLQRHYRVARVFAIVGVLIVALFFRQVPLSSVHFARTALPGTYNIDHFIDGDTIAVNMDGHVESIRLLGVDTPETVKPNTATQCFGPEASDFVKRAIGAEPVRLVADPMSDNRDRYNRLVRYVYLSDGTLLDQVLIEQGYGFAYLLYPFSKHDDFAMSEEKARSAHRGLWASCQSQFDGMKWQSNDL